MPIDDDDRARLSTDGDWLELLGASRRAGRHPDASRGHGGAGRPRAPSASRHGSDRSRPPVIRLPAQARAADVDPAELRPHRDRSLLPGVRVDDQGLSHPAGRAQIGRLQPVNSINARPAPTIRTNVDATSSPMPAPSPRHSQPLRTIADPTCALAAQPAPTASPRIAIGTTSSPADVRGPN